MTPSSRFVGAEGVSRKCGTRKQKLHLGLQSGASGVRGKCWPAALGVPTVRSMKTTTTPLSGLPPLPSEQLLFLETTRDWWWGANHLEDIRLPIVGGLPHVRTLVRALDGASWPWTTIGTAGASWFQVLGTAAACMIELGTSTQAWRVAHAYRPDPSRHRMPPGCRWWVRSCRADEVFTALEAASIGIRYLLGHPFRKSLVLHEARPSRPGSRR